VDHRRRAASTWVGLAVACLVPFPAPGAAAASLGAPAAGPAIEDLYGTALRRITVQPEAAAAPGPADSESGLPGWAPAGLAAGLLLLAALLIVGGRRARPT